MANTTTDKYEQLIELIKSGEADYIKFSQKGNKAAGTRVRTLIQEVKKLAQEVRMDIQAKKKKEIKKK